MQNLVIDTTVTANNIRELQEKLLTLSHTTMRVPRVAVTGVWDAQTESALIAFQRYADLPETGLVDHATWQALTELHAADTAAYRMGEMLCPLYHAQLLSNASAPENIPYFTELLQVLLRTLAAIPGFYPTANITGVYDTQTAAAVSMVQQYTGLPKTGRLDLATWNALVGLYNGEMMKLQSSPPIKAPTAKEQTFHRQ